MFAKLNSALIAVGIAGAFVIGGCAAAGLIYRFGSSPRLSDRGDACDATDPADPVPVSEEPCHEN